MRGLIAGNKKLQRVLLIAILVLMLSLVFAQLGGMELLRADVGAPDSNAQPDEVYNQMKTAFYKAFNSFIMPTLIMLSVFMFICAGIFLGIKWSKAEGAEKQAEVKKQAIHWAIGIVVAFMTPVLVQGIAEVVIGFSSGVWG